MKAKLGYVTKHYPANIASCEQQEAILGDSNYNRKTDPDATFMRLKADHMSNGQLKPAYNVQISTSNQFITNYTIHSNTTDTNTLAEHLEQYEKSYGSGPKSLTADAGYGSEENYMLLEKKQITAFVKYNLFDKRQHQAFNNKNPFSAEKLFYNAEEDQYICPMGQKMTYIGNSSRTTATGFIQTTRLYKAQN